MGSNTSKALEQSLQSVVQNGYSKVMDQINQNKEAISEDAKKVLEQVVANAVDEYKKAYPDKQVSLQKINDALQVVLDPTNKFKQTIQLGGALKKASECDKVKNSFTELTNVFVTEYCLTKDNLIMNHNDYINKIYFRNLVLGENTTPVPMPPQPSPPEPVPLPPVPVPLPSPTGSEPVQAASPSEILQTIKERLEKLQQQVNQKAPVFKESSPTQDELEQVLSLLTSTAVQKLNLIGLKPEVVKSFDSPYIAYVNVKDETTETSVNRVYMIDVSTAVKSVDLCKGEPVQVNDVRRSNIMVSDKYCVEANQMIIGVTQNDTIYGRTMNDKVPVIETKVAKTTNDYYDVIDKMHNETDVRRVAWGLGYGRGLWGSYGTYGLGSCGYGVGLGCGVGLGLGYVPSVVGSVAVVPPTTYVSSVGSVIGGVSAVIPSVGVQSVIPSVGVQSVIPSVGVQSVIPSVGVQSVIPSVGVQSVVPSYNLQTVVPSVGVQSVVPSYGLQTVVPSLGAVVPSVGSVVPSYGTVYPSYGLGYSVGGAIVPRSVVPGVGGIIIKSDLPDEIGTKIIRGEDTQSSVWDDLHAEQYDQFHVKFTKKEGQKVMYIKGSQNGSEVSGKYVYDFNSDRWVITGKQEKKM